MTSLTKIAALAGVSVLSAVAFGQFSENFDSYANLAPMHGVNGWKGWDNLPIAGALVSNTHSSSGPNSVKIDNLSDLVHEFTGTSGKWSFFAKSFLPTGTTGDTYFIFLNTYNDGPAGQKEWSIQMKFNAGAGTVIDDFFAPPQPSAPLVQGSWAPIGFIVDLDNDLCEEYYNGQRLVTRSWTVSTTGNTTLGAVDLYANGPSNGNFTGSIWYDDVVLRQVPSVDGTVTLEAFSADPTGFGVLCDIRNTGSTTSLENHVIVLNDALGAYTVGTNVAAGTYDIAYKRSHWLRKVVPGVVIPSSGSVTANVSLVNGDVDGDNEITLADYGLLSTAFGSVNGDPNWNPNADLDGDGEVTLADYSTLANNFGQAGDD